MRVIVFFDLPTTTKSERCEYAKFRKFLIKSGFMMMQESVYSKIALNQNVATGICDSVKKQKRRRVLCKCLPLPKSSSPKWK